MMKPWRPVFFFFLLGCWLFPHSSNINAASNEIISYMAGKTAFLVVNQRVVLSLASDYRGQSPKERIQIVKKRLEQLLIHEGIIHAENFSVICEHRQYSITYRGDLIVWADFHTAEHYRSTPRKMVAIWRDNFRNAFQLNGLTAKETMKGLASWYGKELHGRRTANGEIFIETKYTAAHRFLPFGTKLRVTNLNNGLKVMVTVNDRGPWIRGRLIDLSWAAARAVKIYGVSPVMVEVLATQNE